MWIHPDAAAVGFDNRLGQVQSETGSLRFTDSLVGAIEAVKHVRDVGRINSWTVVADTHDDLLWPDLTANAYLAAWRIFDRI